MRQIVLDTETTGLETTLGHRIIEIGCIELIARRVTGRTWHTYLNPDRPIEQEAAKVHGISQEFLLNQPRFAEKAPDLIDFLRGSELLIHNAPFDIGFLNYELSLLDPELGRIEDICKVTDTLIMARALYPGQKNNLDALCKRYGIDNSQRDLHGALLDAGLLAQVYLSMSGGQANLLLGAGSKPSSFMPMRISSNRKRLLVSNLTGSEINAHQEKLASIDKSSNGNCLWRRIIE